MEAYTILPARYAKGKFVIQTHDADANGFRGVAGLAAAHLGLKYIGRDHGYRASKAQTVKFEIKYAEIMTIRQQEANKREAEGMN